MLCSDGRSPRSSVNEIAGFVIREMDLSSVADDLVGAAADHGGRDNVSVVDATSSDNRRSPSGLGQPRMAFAIMAPWMAQ